MYAADQRHVCCRSRGRREYYRFYLPQGIYDPQNDPDKLRKVYEIGRRIAEERVEEIKAFLH